MNKAMANSLIKTINVLPKPPHLSAMALRFGSATPISNDDVDTPIIGNREIVGYGMNGTARYLDRLDVPFPAIRFLPPDAPGLKALREKEKGDWKKLTRDEKKALYRASFCQTLAELNAPDTQWKSSVGAVFFSVGFAIWVTIFLKEFVLDPLPESLSLEKRQAQLQRMLDMEVGIIEGLSSRYDYEKKTWK